jgi:hypothetical protein
MSDALRGFFGSVTPAGWIQIVMLFAALVAMGTRAEYRLMAVEDSLRDLRTEYIRKEVVELQMVVLSSHINRLQMSLDRMERRIEERAR